MSKKQANVRGSLQKMAMVLMASAAVGFATTGDLNTAIAGKPSGAGGGKGGGKGGDEPAAPSSCADSSGEFPAMVYEKRIVNKRGRVSGSEFYLANSDNSCALMIHSRSSWGYEPVYRQIGNEGRIVYADATDNSVKYLKFNISNREVVESLPLAASTIYQHPTSPVGIVEVELSKSGNRAYFTLEERNANGEWKDDVYSSDLSSCSSNCPLRHEIALAAGVEGFLSLAINDNEDRMVMSISSMDGSQKSVSLSFKDANGWSQPRAIVNNSDDTAVFVDVNEFNELSLLGDKLAISYHNEARANYISVLDISACSAVGSQSCLSSGEAVLLHHNLPGQKANFASSDKLLASETQVLYSIDLNNESSSAIGTGDSPNAAE